MDGPSAVPTSGYGDVSLAVAGAVATAAAQQVVAAATLFASLGLGTTVDATA